MTKELILAAWFAQVTLALPNFIGKIQDGLGAPVDGAEIALWDAETGKGLQTTSIAGRFALNGVKEGDYLLKVEKGGMAVLYGAVRLKGDSDHELNLILAKSAAGKVSVAMAEPPFRDPAAGVAPPPQKPPKIRGSKLIHRVDPVYPPSARLGRIAGNVKIWTVLREDGTLDDLVVLSAPTRDLALAALDGVRQWRYTPTYSDGKAVEVEFTIDVNFGL